MSVDLFGRQLTKSGGKRGAMGVRGPAGEGFRITPDGHYDMHGKRLCNIAEARDLNDAVSQKTVLAIVKEQTREIQQVTTSLKYRSENNYQMINGLQSRFELHQRSGDENGDRALELATRNAELIRQIDSRLVHLEKGIGALAPPQN